MYKDPHNHRCRSIMSRLIPLDICFGPVHVGKIYKKLCYIKKTVHDCDFFCFYSSVLWALYCPDFKAICRIYSTDESSYSLLTVPMR